MALAAMAVALAGVATIDGGPTTSGPRQIGGLPEGLGMWTWMPERTEGGDVERIVARAASSGLTHLFVRTGDSTRGLTNLGFLDVLLPAAHRLGLKVYGWDFPHLADVASDVARASAALGHRTPGGHRLDGFSADIETPAEGTRLSVAAVRAYGSSLRAALGDDATLIATVPNPTPHFQAVFPYADLVGPFDAVAPMVYWHDRDPAADMARAAALLAPLGKPLLPVGQAFDGRPEGGPPGPPPPSQIVAFLDAARAAGAPAASFWSWQHASAEIWATLASHPSR